MPLLAHKITCSNNCLGIQTQVWIPLLATLTVIINMSVEYQDNMGEGQGIEHIRTDENSDSEAESDNFTDYNSPGH